MVSSYLYETHTQPWPPCFIFLQYHLQIRHNNFHHCFNIHTVVGVAARHCRCPSSFDFRIVRSCFLLWQYFYGQFKHLCWSWMIHNRLLCFIWPLQLIQLYWNQLFWNQLLYLTRSLYLTWLYQIRLFRTQLKCFTRLLYLIQLVWILLYPIWLHLIWPVQMIWIMKMY